MEWVFGLGIPAAWLLVGAFYARTQAVAAHLRATAEWGSEYFDPGEATKQMIRNSTLMQLAWRTLFWPAGILFDCLRGGVANWFLAPINDRRERHEQLQRDAEAWREKQYRGTPEEMAVAAEIAKVLEDLAKEAKL